MDRDCGYSTNCHQVSLSLSFSLSVPLSLYTTWRRLGARTKTAGTPPTAIRSIYHLPFISFCSPVFLSVPLFLPLRRVGWVRGQGLRIQHNLPPGFSFSFCLSLCLFLFLNTWRMRCAWTGTADPAPTVIRSTSLFILLPFSLSSFVFLSVYSFFSTTWRRLGARTGTAAAAPVIRSTSLFLLLPFSLSSFVFLSVYSFFLYHVEEVGCEDKNCGYSANCHQVYLSLFPSVFFSVFSSFSTPFCRRGWL